MSSVARSREYADADARRSRRSRWTPRLRRRAAVVILFERRQSLPLSRTAHVADGPMDATMLFLPTDAQPPHALANWRDTLQHPDWLAEHGDAWRKALAHDVVKYEAIDPDLAPRWTCIIIAYRSKEFLLEALDIGRACTSPDGGPVEWLVVDCGGLEPLLPEIRKRADSILTLTPDIGLNPARNAALAYARGAFVAILDDDGLIAPDWLVRAERHFDDPSVVALRGRIRFKAHRYFTTLASHYDRGEGVVDDTLAVEGNMASRRGAYYASNGFGTRFYGGEGAWMTWRLLKALAGCRVIYAPDVIMRHDFYQNWQHFLRKARSYSNILDQLAVQESAAQEFQQFLHADWNKSYPKRQMRPDERVAWAALHAAKWCVQWQAKAAVSGDRTTASPRR